MKQAKRTEKTKTIMNLNLNTCRYIINSDTSQAVYCCEPVTRKSYCNTHAKICYLPKEAKNAHALD